MKKITLWRRFGLLVLALCLSTVLCACGDHTVTHEDDNGSVFGIRPEKDNSREEDFNPDDTNEMDNDWGTQLKEYLQSKEDDSEEVTVNCTISVVVDGETKFGPFDMVVSGTTENPPTVLQAVTEALQHNEVNCETDSNNRLSLITLDGEDFKSYADDVNVYGWYYLCNGIEPETGTMNVNTVNEGDVIEVRYLISPIVPEDLGSDAE